MAHRAATTDLVIPTESLFVVVFASFTAVPHSHFYGCDRSRMRYKHARAEKHSTTPVPTFRLKTIL